MRTCSLCTKWAQCAFCYAKETRQILEVFEDRLSEEDKKMLRSHHNETAMCQKFGFEPRV